MESREECGVRSEEYTIPDAEAGVYSGLHRVPTSSRAADDLQKVIHQYGI